MSLRVWLPLNGDLTNNGLSDVVVTNNGATVDNAGKIGKCYYFNGNSSYMWSSDYANLGDTFSVCAWVKLKSTGRNDGLFCTRTATYGGFTIFFNAGILTVDPCASSYSASTRWATNFTASTNTWYHIVITRTPTTVSAYVNGQFLQSKEVTFSSSYGNCFTIGSYNTNGSGIGTLYYGYMNDFRIYDHALSPKEVKLLSQGLVCHYKLSDRGGDNIIPDTSPNESQYTYPSSGYSDKFSKTSTIVPSASQYVLSFWAKSTHAGDKVRAHWYSPNTTTRAETNQGITSTASDGRIDFTLSDKWEKYWCIWTQSSTTAVKHFIFPRMFSQSSGGATGTGTVSVKFVKLEEGDTPTIWKPNKVDSYYSYFEYDDKLVYDSSGYNNHAQIWHYDEYGTIVSTSDTTRNSIATYINSEKVTTNTASGTWMIYGDCALTTPSYLTVAFWCKPFNGYGGSVGQGQFCTTTNAIGIVAGTDYNTTAIHHRDSGYDLCSSTSVHKRVNVAFTAKEWHHYAVVYDGRYGRVYKDGIETGTADLEAVVPLASFSAIVIGYSHAGGAVRSNKAYYSDFRVYATALSEEDIQELYNTPVSIANTGAMLTQGEFVEVAT